MRRISSPPQQAANSEAAMKTETELPIVAFDCNVCNQRHEGERIPTRCERCRCQEFSIVRATNKDQNHERT
jgi:Zn finger protein HypA/HybF involved in hydrogenase expression